MTYLLNYQEAYIAEQRKLFSKSPPKKSSVNRIVIYYNIIVNIIRSLIFMLLIFTKYTLEKKYEYIYISIHNGNEY